MCINISIGIDNFPLKNNQKGEYSSGSKYQTLISSNSLSISVLKHKLLIEKKYDKIHIAIIGTIYNSHNTIDTSYLILKHYIDNNLKYIGTLNGEYLIIIHDDEKKKLFIINDRFGLNKLYYLRRKNSLSISSRLLNLMCLHEKDNIREQSLIEYLYFGYISENHTFYNDIYQINQASIIEIAYHNKISFVQKPYWSYLYTNEYKNENTEELIDELYRLWQQSVKRRISQNDKIILPLSGGLDSRAILASIIEQTSTTNLVTCTFGEKLSWDYQIGTKVAKKFGIKNINLDVEKYQYEEQFNISFDDSDGMVDATPYLPILEYKDLLQYSNTIISGYIGDFIMGSHMFKELNYLISDYHSGSIDINSHFLKINALNDLEKLKEIFNKSVFHKIENPIDIALSSFSENTNLSDIYFLHFLNNHVYNYSYYNVFRFRDDFNYLSPFLDYDLIDFMCKIPHNLRYNQKLYRLMLIRKYPDFYKIPCKNMYNTSLNSKYYKYFINKALNFSQKRINKLLNNSIGIEPFLDLNLNYIDYNKLIRKDKAFQNVLYKYLKKLDNTDYFNMDSIDELWYDHRFNNKNNSRIIGLLVTFSMFYNNN